MRALHAAPAPAAAPRFAAAARPRARPATQRRAAAGASGPPAALVELPASTDAQVAQCRAAVQSAVEAGVTRQRLLLTLPLIGATDLGAPHACVAFGATARSDAPRGRRLARRRAPDVERGEAYDVHTAAGAAVSLRRSRECGAARAGRRRRGGRAVHAALHRRRLPDGGHAARGASRALAQAYASARVSEHCLQPSR
jgi:hypothetical protein